MNLLERFRARSRSATRAVYQLATHHDYKSVWNAAAVDNAKNWIFTGATDESFESSGRGDAARLLPLVDPTSAVLNIGCGIGRVEKYLAPHVAAISSVDISGEMIERARRRLADAPNVTLREVAVGEFLSAFEAESFDLVFSLLVLQHMEREDAFCYLEHAHRVLKPGGHLFVQFPNLLSPEYTPALVEAAHQSPRSPGRVRAYTKEEVRHVLEILRFDVLTLQLSAGARGDAEIYVTAKKPGGSGLNP